MSVDAISDSVTLDELNAKIEASSTWNGRDVQCAPLDDEALLVRTLAFAHLAAQKESLQAVRKLEQEIYALGGLEDEEQDETDPSLDDPEIDTIIATTQSLACWTTPELLKAEERVKLLLNDPTRPHELLQFNKSFFDKAVKGVREAGRKTKKAIKKHKKAIIVTVAVIVAVAVVIITKGAGTSEAIAGVAAAAATPTDEKDKKRDEKKQSSPQQSDPPQTIPPTQPIDFNTPPLTGRVTAPLENNFVNAPNYQPQNTLWNPSSDVTISSPVSSINYYPMDNIPPLVLSQHNERPSNASSEPTFANPIPVNESVSSPERGFSAKKIETIVQPVRRTPETEQVNSTAIVAMTPLEQLPLKTEETNVLNVGAAGFSHSLWKAVGSVIDNTFAMGEMFNPTISIPPKEKTAREAWEQNVVPAVHEKIDRVFSTNIKEEFDKKNDSFLTKVLDSVIYNPASYMAGKLDAIAKVIKGASSNTTVASAVLNEATAGVKAATTMPGRVTTTEEVGIVSRQIVEEEIANLGQSQGFSGKRGFELKFPQYQDGVRHTDEVINGRKYVGHAIDQMQNRGIPPSAIENTIKTGIKTPDPILGRMQYHDPINKITVIIEEASGNVVTAIGG